MRLHCISAQPVCGNLVSICHYGNTIAAVGVQLGACRPEMPQFSAHEISVFCSVALEEGFSEAAIAELERKGHKIAVSGHARGVFGRGQIIQRNPKTGVLSGGSDPRADGYIIGW